MQIEQIEPRTLLSSVSFDQGVLKIIGTQKNDSVVLSLAGKDVVVKTSFASQASFGLSPGDKIDIELLGGNDRTAINNAITFPTTILGGAGNDSLCGSGGNDLIDGGSGNDSLNGGDGDDRLVDTSGSTVMDGGAGYDAADFSQATIGVTFDMSNKGLEVLLGGAGPDNLTGSNGDDVILGNGGQDTLHGMGGDDVVDGGQGHDQLFGDDGDDLFINQDREADTIDGGTGYNFVQEDKDNAGTSLDKRTNIQQFYDKTVADPSAKAMAVVQAVAAPVLRAVAPSAISVQSAVSVLSISPATLSGGILSISGTSAADSISVILDARGKNVSVSVNATSASFPLASVKEIIVDAGGGNDSIALQRSDGTRAVPIMSSILGGKGDDRIVGGSGSDVVSGGAGNDSILGMAGEDKLIGDAGNDTIDGGAGNDLLDGGADADVIRGGDGLSDTVDYSLRFNPISVDLSNSSKANDGEKGEGDQVFADVENVFGGNGNDRLIGNASANLISGGNGDDTMIGNGGHDKFIGGKGADNITSGADSSLFSILDFTRDNFNGALNASGLPSNAFVSGDVGMDFSTASGGILR